jgi:alanyl-tRNA synthetase
MTNRQAIMRNHSATHLMHKALREVLGSHVQQRGSLVDASKTRFDFVHTAPVSREEMLRVEELVNSEILNNQATTAQVMLLEQAQKTGAMMLFGEKYGESVRVLEIGTSKELCGGTHVTRTGDIGLFKICSESGVAAGIRRIEAVTGQQSLSRIQKLEAQVFNAAQILKANPDEIEQRVLQLQEHVRELEKELMRSQSKLASNQGNELISQVITVQGVKVLVTQFDVVDSKVLRETVDHIKNKLGSCIVLLASVHDGKLQLIAGVTSDLIKRVQAGVLVNYVAMQVGGKGGGKPDLAMAGGTQPENLSGALASVNNWLAEHL